MTEHMLIGFLTGLALYLLYISNKCRFQVNEGSVAILTSFGRAILINKETNHLKTFLPGLHFKWPWQKVYKISIMEQMIDLSDNESASMAMVADGTLLRLDAKLRYSPLKTNLYEYLFSMGKANEHIKSLFTCLLHNEIASFENKNSGIIKSQEGSYAALRKDRQQMNQHIQEFFTLKMGENYGIHFDGVDLTDILPPDELAHALNGVINAQSEAQRSYAQTEGECEQRLIAAKKGIAIAQAKAKAVEEEIMTLVHILEKLQKNGTLQQYIERRKVEVFSESKLSYIKR
ncbi:SPFH domain-containing protein [Fluviispira sanaruensis]|uniref:SPFH domain-containing protein n=1 Tax=Fluviispira sanaruensis TaxID=2493639 RepID=A0A4P2VJW9_FLUSA|nr:SPFH domain-containing protein [Fluviispira sanaruensis]BBH53543.1 SPFH domain-containing protein [Fluviispira sanaruensis]